MKAATEQIPDIVIGRLPIYLRALTHLANEGNKATTSSHELGRHLGISSAQIRKDLSHFGEFGKQGTGYHINYLIEQLRDILQLDKEWGVALVGAGYLGHALVHYHGFQNRGFQIRWIFDVDETLVGEMMKEIPIQHVREMAATVKNQHIQMAIIAVPATQAQDVANALIKAGVHAILNYAPISLNVPKGVHVAYSDPVVQLQHMTYYLDPG